MSDRVGLGGVRVGVTVVSLTCARCGSPFLRAAAEVNRQRRRQGERYAAYCSQRCATLVNLADRNEPAWSSDEEAYLRANFRKMRHREMAAVLGRTKTAVSLRCAKLKLRKGPALLAGEDEMFILNNYRRMGTAELAARIGRNRSVVTHFLQRRGLTLKPRKQIRGDLERKIRDFHAEGFNDPEIGELVGVCPEAVMRWRKRKGLKPNGYTVRSRARIGDKTKARQVRHNYFRQLLAPGRKAAAAMGWPQARTEEQARILGVLADGPLGIGELVGRLGDVFAPLMQLIKYGLVRKQWAGAWPNQTCSFLLADGVRRVESNPAGINAADHLGLVRMMALRYRADPRRLEESWQYADGMLGLADAIRVFDPGRGFQFSTLATKCIEHRLRKELQARKMQKRAGQEYQTAFSQMGDGEDDVAGRLATSEDAPLNEASAEAEKLLAGLDQRSRRLVRRVLMEEWTLAAAGAAESPPIGKERVRQIIEKATERMRRRAGGVLPIPEPA